MVELCRIFLDSSRPSAYIFESQNIISRTSLFRTFFSILSRSDICDELRVSTALVTSEIVFGNNKNQSLLSEFYEDFYRVDFADKVLSVAHDHTQSHAVRKSMLYLFGCYIRGNLSGLQKIVHGVLNQETSVVSKFLCAGLFDDDFMSTTITSFCFIHIMINNPQYKTEFARMAFIVDKSDSQTAFNLISRCVSIIQPQTNPISSINMLCLLIYLIYDCEEALNTFLESSDISSFMIMGIKSGYGSNLDTVIKGLFAVLVGTVLNALQERADSQITKNLMAHVSLVDLKSLITKLNESSEFVASSKSRIINLSLKVYIDYEITLIVKKIEIFVIDSLRYHSQDRSKLADLQDQLQAMTNEFKSVSEECKHLKNHLEAANKRVHDLEIKNDQLMRANNGLTRDFNVLLHDHQVLVSQYTYLEEEVRRLNYELYSVMGGQYHNMDSSLPETEGQIANQDLNKDNMTNVEYLDRS
ncbi:General vesicular transport factor p115 [Thelohanellus kitauei]|uniref:General vesicular transport factor p115 n=1 Tax=Thelohanellus kitauei TaxID=669202 RepID=A0A0C2NDZ1_THEKT|nr:General vesicular transport factor p115 [Thelohanellus kitauei]